MVTSLTAEAVWKQALQGWVSRGDAGAIRPQDRRGQAHRETRWRGCRSHGLGGLEEETPHRQRLAIDSPQLWAGEVRVNAVGSGLAGAGVNVI